MEKTEAQEIRRHRPAATGGEMIKTALYAMTPRELRAERDNQMRRLAGLTTKLALIRSALWGINRELDGREPIAPPPVWKLEE